MDTMIPPPPLPAGGCVALSSCSTSHRVALLATMGCGTCTANTAPGAVKPGGLRTCLRMAGTVVNAAAGDPGSEGAAEALAQPLSWPNTLVPDCLPTLIPALQNSASLLFLLHLQSCLQALYTFSLLFLAHPAYSQFWPAASCSEGRECPVLLQFVPKSTLVFCMLAPPCTEQQLCRAGSRFTWTQ